MTRLVCSLLTHQSARTKEHWCVFQVTFALHEFALVRALLQTWCWTVICAVSAHSVACNTECWFSVWFWQFSPLVSQQMGEQDLAIWVMWEGTGEMQRTTSLRTLMHCKPSWEYVLSQWNKEQWGRWADVAAAGSLPSLSAAWAVQGHGPSLTVCRAHRSASYSKWAHFSGGTDTHLLVQPWSECS